MTHINRACLTLFALDLFSSSGELFNQHLLPLLFYGGHQCV
jgi:hypothetical protein